MWQGGGMAPRLTPKGAATKQRIIEGAAAEIRERRVTEVTLDDICAYPATSKSRFSLRHPAELAKDATPGLACRREARRPPCILRDALETKESEVAVVDIVLAGDGSFEQARHAQARTWRGRCSGRSPSR
jgi:hypothetical protein